MSNQNTDAGRQSKKRKLDDVSNEQRREEELLFG